MKTFRNRCKVETSSVRKMKTVFSDNSLIIIALYVDDLIIAGTTTDVNEVNSRYFMQDKVKFITFLVAKLFVT